MNDDERTEEWTIDLSTVKLLNLGRGKASRVIRCLSGSIWVTQEGDSRDHILHEGQEVVIDTPNLAVIQAFQSARVRIQSRPRSGASPVNDLEMFLYHRDSRDLPAA